MTESNEQLAKQLLRLKKERDDAIVMGLAVSGVGSWTFNERVHELNEQIESLERQVDGRARD
jgi:hypothetical protein